MSSREIRRALEALLDSSPEDWGAILSRNPQLLTPAVDKPLEYLVDAARRDGDDLRLFQAEYLEELLREGRRVGPEAMLVALVGEDAVATDAGYDFWERYRATGDPHLLDAAIEGWDAVFAACAPDAPDFAVAANNVATGRGERYLRTGSPEDLRLAVDAAGQALAATPADALQRPMRLLNWANLELQLFEVSGEETHLDAAIDALREAVDRAGDSPEQALALTNYATALYARYHRSQSDSDLDAVVDAAAEAVRLTPPGSRAYAERQSSLAAGLERRYLDRGDAGALDRALAAWDEALANSEPVDLEVMFAAGRGNWRRHGLSGDAQDAFVGAERLGTAFIWGVDDARPLLEDLLAAGDGEDVPPPLATFVHRLEFEREQYARTGNPRFLDAATRGWPVALAQPSLGPAYPVRRASSAHLAAQARWQRFEERGQDEDMSGAIELFEEAVALTEPGSSNLAPRQANLGRALATRASRSADGADLPRARAMLESALDDDIPIEMRAGVAQTLAGALVQEAKRGPTAEGAAGVARAIDLLDEVRAALPANAAERRAIVVALAGARLELYDYTHDPATLERATAELELEPAPGSPEELQRLLWLARALVDRHTLHGRPEDLERAIGLLEQAVDQTEGSRLQAVVLEELGLARLRRGANLNRLSDRERGLDAVRSALDAAAPGTLEYWERLGLVGVATVEHASVTGDDEELARGVDLLRQAEARLPAGSQRRPLVLRALADAGEPDVEPVPVPGSPIDPLALARASLRRYETTRASTDLDEVVSAYESAAAAELSPQYRGLSLSALGRALVVRHRRDGRADDRERAIDCFRTACGLALELDPMIAFRAAQSWAELEAADRDWQAASEPYRIGLDALARLLASHALRAEKEVWLREARGFAADAALGLSFAQSAHDAIVALEQNRALLLTDVLQREQFDLERLRAGGRAELADRFEHAAGRVTALEAAEVAGDLRPRRPARSSLADELADARAALDDAVDAIRAVEGYGDAFATAGFDEIVSLAGDAPVVYLCPGPVWGAALVVAGGDAPPPLLLPGLVTDRVGTGAGYYLDAYAARTAEPDRWRGQLDLTLSWLWDAAIGPLFDTGLFSDLYLGARRPGEARPVVLVPVGPLALLPLHAAWTEDEDAPGGRRYALDELRVAYAPNVRVHAEARRRARRAGAPRLLAVEEPLPVAAGPLPGAAAEVAATAHAAPGATVLRHGDATVDAVVTQLRTHTAAHFACHGQADPDDPLSSYLLLAGDERLELRAIMQQRLAELELVVLSACETAVVGHALPDEVVGLPAGLLRAGAGGVIASSWSVPDASTAMLLTRFYELWPKHPEPAEALRRAQQWVRDSSNGEKLERMPELMRGEAARVPAVGRRLWENAHGHRHPYFWAGFSYTGG